jgi:putative transposase
LVSGILIEGDTGRPKATLTMSSDERTHLLAITRSRSLPAALTLRAKIVLACERERVSPARPSWRRGLASGPIRSAKWRNRFITDRIVIGEDAVLSLYGRDIAQQRDWAPR